MLQRLSRHGCWGLLLCTLHEHRDMFVSACVCVCVYVCVCVWGVGGGGGGGGGVGVYVYVCGVRD